MGRVGGSVPRSRVPWHRRLFLDPAALRYWLAVAAVAVVLTAAVHRSLAGADALRTRWGPTTPVLVTTEPVRAGDPLGPATAVTRFPRALTPSEVVTSSRAGDRAAVDLDAGTPLTAALVRDGDRARRTERLVAIATVDPGLDPGDRVDVWATADPTLEPTAAEASRPLVEGARVVRTGDDQIVVAVATGEVGPLVAAANLSSLTVAMVP